MGRGDVMIKLHILVLRHQTYKKVHQTFVIFIKKYVYIYTYNSKELQFSSHVTLTDECSICNTKHCV